MDETEILKQLSEKFDDKLLKVRTIQKKDFAYIPEPLIRNRLNEVMELNWEWTIQETSLVPHNYETERLTYHTHVRDPRENLQVIVRGALTLHLPSGKSVTREAFGGSSLINGSMAGDAYKTAASSAFKKAAYLFNIGAYLGLDDLEGRDDTVEMSLKSKPKSVQAFSNGPQTTKKKISIPGFNS